MSKHTCKALVISCIDFRFITQVRDFLAKKALVDNYDLITVPGASLGVAKIKESVLTSSRLHEPKEIYIFDHEDCGAYGKNNSMGTHVKNLKAASCILAKEYPGREVKTYLAHFNKIEEIS